MSVGIARAAKLPNELHGPLTVTALRGLNPCTCRSPVCQILAEVNPHMPRTHGNAFLPVEAIDYFVRNDRQGSWQVPAKGVRGCCFGLDVWMHTCAMGRATWLRKCSSSTAKPCTASLHAHSFPGPCLS